MRRSLAITVLLVFGGMLLVPAFAGLTPPLPACCRANGSHHCTGTASLPGDGFRDAAPKCPYSHARLLPRPARAQAPATVPEPHLAPAAAVRLALTRPAAPAFGLPSPRAPPALPSL